MLQIVDWQHIHHIHFVGIKGVAMTALAVWAKEKGYTVTGSDVDEKFPTDEVLAEAGIDIFSGFSVEHVNGDVVVYTGAHKGKENVEVIEATKRNIPAVPHGIALGQIMNDSIQISIAGCHGKTTTSAMIATVLTHAKLDPSYAIGGGKIRGLGLPGHAGKGNYFIAEADEYMTDPGHDMTPRFLWQQPDFLVITAIDFDHPDVYSSIDDVGKAYISLVKRMRGKKYLIFDGNDQYSVQYLGDKHPYTTYGFSSTDITVSEGKQSPQNNNGIFHYRGTDIPFTLRVPGKHNLLNATAAFMIGKELGIETNILVEGLEKFGGVSRRFEYIGQIENVPVIDDYAHHPAEIQATLNAAREWYPDHHIIVLFQPHTYSRTKALLSSFGTAFSAADEIGILPIYASAREKEKTIDAQDVVNEIAKHHNNVSFVPSLSLFDEQYTARKTKHDIILCLGAGDIGRTMKEMIGGRT